MNRFSQWITIVATLWLISGATARATDIISLAGEWRFEMAGTNAELWAWKLPGKMHLPGTMDDAGLGPKNTKAPTLAGPYRLYDYAGPAW